jgi:hypothetical protein
MTPKKNAKLAYDAMVAMGAKPTPEELRAMDQDADKRLSECKCGMAICEDCQQAKAMKELANMWRS